MAKPKTFNLKIGYEAADALMIEVLKNSVSNIRWCKKKYPHSTPEDIEYETKYIAACKLIIHHFGG